MPVCQSVDGDVVAPGAGMGRWRRPGAVTAVALASESPSRALVTVVPEAAAGLAAAAGRAGVPLRRLGVTGGDALTIPGVLELPVAELRDAYEGALPRALGERA